MVTKLKKEVFPVHPISRWSVVNSSGPLYINPTWEIKLYKGMSLDVEDDEQGNFVCIGIYDPCLKTSYCWNDWELAKKLELKPFIAHNGRSDIEKLKKWGFDVGPRHLYWDTQIIAHILDSSASHGFGLKDLVKKQCGIEYPEYETIVGKHKTKCPRNVLGCCGRVTLDRQDPTLVAEYNAMDCFATYELHVKQLDALGGVAKFDNSSPTALYFNEIEKSAAFVFQKMESSGIRIDVPYLKKLEQELSSKKAPLEAEIKNELGDINLNSTKQLLEALSAKEIYPVFKGKPSTDKRALERLRNVGVIDALLRFSELETLLSSFVRPYLERQTEIVHPNFNQCGTRTGRPSCSNPNLLQIPRRTDNGKLVRRMFIPREGFLFGDCDFGQIEPRILAHLSKDKSMLEMFNKGIDFHTFTAERLQISRDAAKVLNLSVGYRATAASVSQQLKCSWEKAEEEIEKWWSAFPGLWDWEAQLIYESKQSGYFTTLMGRRIKVEDLNHGNKWRREAAERQLINNIAQASAAEVMKKGMVAVDKAGVTMLVQVYDELVIEEKEEDIEAAMYVAIDALEHCVTLDVPLVVDAGIGCNWEACK